MIEICLKYDNMHTFGIINALICINNHVNSCINSMLSGGGMRAAAVAWGRRRRGDDDEVSVAGARSGGARHGGGGDGNWTPSPAFLEQPFERESTPFFL